MADHLNSFKERTQQELNSVELDKRILELSALFEISKTLNASLELKSILDNILLVPMGRMMISKGIILSHTVKDNFDVLHLKGLNKALAEHSLSISNFPENPIIINGIQDDSTWLQFFRENKIELLVPIESSLQFRGLLGYGKKLSGTDYSDDEIQFLSSLGNIAAQSIENAKMVDKLNSANRSLDQKLQELNTLFEIGRELNQIFDRPSILKQLSFSLMGQMLVNQFFVALKHEEVLKVEFNKGSNFSRDKIGDCEKTCNKLETVTTPLIIKDEPAYGALKRLGVSVIVPMAHQNTINGYIFLGSKLDKSEFTNSDLSFLSTLANMVIISLENSRLIRETIEKERLEEELNLAKTIQQRLLPDQMPDIPGYDVHGLNLSSKQVGGDYFDIIPVSGNEYLFTIADVSGKGMPAALLMSNLQAGLHSLAGEQYSLNQTTAKLNNLIHRNTTIEKYITFFVLKLNVENGEFEFVNAGHNPPYMFSNSDEYQALEDGGIILGMMPDMPYQLGRGKIKPGGCLVMFTDGVTEAMNEDEEEFTENRVIEFYKNNMLQNNSEQLNNLLLDKLSDFSEEDPTQGDDVTLLTLKCK